jgi:predicted transcriptional regulator
MEYVFKVNSKKYHRAMLEIYNFNLKLSDFELDIVATMLTNGISEINPITKELLRVTLNKDKYITNNYIKRLKDKGILLPKKDERGYILNPSVANLTKDNKVSFELITE